MAKLETALDLRSANKPKTLFELWDEWDERDQWLREHGFADCLAALEAGVTLPETLADGIRDRAAYDRRDRAWKRVMAALYGDQPLDDASQRQLDADFRLLNAGGQDGRNRTAAALGG
jgi:hypothetical protein